MERQGFFLGLIMVLGSIWLIAPGIGLAATVLWIPLFGRGPVDFQGFWAFLAMPRTYSFGEIWFAFSVYLGIPLGALYAIVYGWGHRNDLIHMGGSDLGGGGSSSSVGGSSVSSSSQAGEESSQFSPDGLVGNHFSAHGQYQGFTDQYGQRFNTNGRFAGQSDEHGNHFGPDGKYLGRTDRDGSHYDADGKYLGNTDEFGRRWSPQGRYEGETKK